MTWRTVILTFAATLHLGAACNTKHKVKARPGQVAVTFGWVTDEFPGTMRVFELDERSSLKPWVTGTVKNAAYLPLGPELDDGTLYLRPGAVRRLVLVAENRTGEDIHFFAAPHAVQPAKLSLGFEFRCLCLNHAYKIPKDRTWYRVVEAKLDKDYAGESMAAVHALVAVDPKRAKDMKTPGATFPPPAKETLVSFENMKDPKMGNDLIELKPALRGCYETHRKKFPDDLRVVAIDVSYKTAKKGKPSGVKVLKVGKVDQGLGQCLVKAFSAVERTFAKPKQELSVRVVFGLTVRKNPW